ncbi:rod shape-determining protein MreC [Elusimicrobiota bacterium]
MKSKKELYTLIILVFMGLVMLVMNNIPSVRVFKDAVVKILFPIAKGVVYPVTSAKGFYSRADKLLNIYEENSILNKEIQVLKEKRGNIEYVEKENERLRNIMGFENISAGFLIPAEVVIQSPDNYFSEFNINKGEKHGIKKDMPVLNMKDSKWILQGRVEEVFENFSKVTLITSPDFRCAVELKNGTLGVICGNNNWILRLKYISPNAEISPGNVVYTSGTGGIFPGGLYIGEVMDVETLKFSQGKEGTVKGVYYPQENKYLYLLDTEQ